MPDPAVLDTNVLLEYEPISKIPWFAVVGYQPVHLVIPLRVIEELDAKKYTTRSQLAKRARRLLPQLETLVRSERGDLSPGVTVGVSIEPGVRNRPADADEEILNTCRELQHFGGRPVTLVTGDTAMLLRSDALGLRTVKMPPGYLRTGD
jgi:predicted ribonuclease YlaK